MSQSTTRELLHRAADHAADWLEGVDERPLAPRADLPGMLERLGGPMPELGSEPRAVLDELAAQADDGLMAINAQRFFGWVMGGVHPAALAADWLVSAWDQNTGLAWPTPLTSAAEEVAGRWLVELLGLPATTSFAFTTGCQMANVTALAAARHRVLADAGWDVERDGLGGAPRVRVLAGAERHVTIDRALRLLGLGAGCLEAVDVDDRGAMRADALEAALAGPRGPVVVCAQAGNVNTGAFDPLPEICDVAHAAGAWVHVDGAFGLWAAASPSRRGLVAGVERADSWASDAHKVLQVPLDCGLALVADPAAHRAAMTVTAAYLQEATVGRDPIDWTPEFSRRARAVPVLAALRSLGRRGIADLVDGLCANAERFAALLEAEPDVDVLTGEFNQVLVRFGDDDATTEAVVARVQQEGTCYLTATAWRERRCARISVCNWKTTAEDVDRSVAAILAAVRGTSATAQGGVVTSRSV
jgi:glutamate/tyrosine decarboxylase-like PLP-dependent enzyme